MARPTGVVNFFEQEWARFWQGWDSLSPEEQLAEAQRRAAVRARSGQINTVSIPGWEDVVHLSPRLEPTTAQRDEFYRARRERRAPQLAPDVIDEIERRRGVAVRIASSTQPPYAAAWGQILTALDNVQDFTTTLATLGRFALYPAIAAVDVATPRFAATGWARTVFGATPEAAQALAHAAARQAASDAFLASRAASLAEYATAASAGLERSALLAAGREAAERAAGTAARAAYAKALTRAGAGIGARLLGRLIPGIGWILLAGDLINMLSWLGMAGMAGYAGICFGLPHALAAGVPLALRSGLGRLGPCGMRNLVHTQAHLNPFAQLSRASRQARLARGTPGIGAILETLQTTDQLYGIGLTFGGIVGSLLEGAYATELRSRGLPVSLTSGPTVLGTGGLITGVAALQTRSKALGAAAAGALLFDTLGRTASAPLREKYKAAQQLQNAPVINGTQETFTEYEHLEQLVNYTGALELVASDLAGVPWQDWLAERMPLALDPPEYWNETTLAVIRDRDPELRTLGRWPLDGAPSRISSDELLHFGTTSIPAAMRDFLHPRRNDAVGMFAGGCYNLITARVWDMLEPGGHFFEDHWTREYRALIALTETPRVVNVAVSPENLWAWWQDMLELADQLPLDRIGSAELHRVANRHGIELLHVEEPYLRASPA